MHSRKGQLGYNNVTIGTENDPLDITTHKKIKIRLTVQIIIRGIREVNEDLFGSKHIKKGSIDLM